MSGVPYHAWTHRPKAEGGTDPIEIPESTPSTPVINWAACRNQTVATTVGSSSTFTTLDMPDYFDDGTGTFQQVTTAEDGLEVVDSEPGVYIVQLAINTSLAGGGGDWLQGAILIQTTGGTSVGRYLSQRAMFLGDGEDFIFVARQHIVPHEGTDGYRFKAQFRHVGAPSFDPVALLIIARYGDKAGGTGCPSTWL